MGPYVIIGFSGGCTIAYEIVQQLLKNGDEVQISLFAFILILGMFQV